MFQRPCASYLVSSRLRPGISRLSPSISRLSPGSPPFLPNALRLSLNGSRLSRRGSPPLSGRRARCASNWRRHSTRYGFLPFACGRVSSPFLAEQGYGEDVHVPAAPVHEGFRVIPRPSEPFPRRRRTAREASRTIHGGRCSVCPPSHDGSAARRYVALARCSGWIATCYLMDP